METPSLSYSTHYTLGHDALLCQTHDELIEATSDTPFVKYNKDERLLVVKGRSTQVGMEEFYFPILEKLKADMKTRKSMRLEFFFHAMNTSTVKVLFGFFKFLRDQKAEGAEVKVVWIAGVDNEDMLETGADLSELYELPFQYRVQ